MIECLVDGCTVLQISSTGAAQRQLSLGHCSYSTTCLSATAVYGSSSNLTPFNSCWTIIASVTYFHLYCHYVDTYVSQIHQFIHIIIQSCDTEGTVKQAIRRNSEYFKGIFYEERSVHFCHCCLLFICLLCFDIVRWAAGRASGL